jgi:hypothetical protein
MLYHRPTGGSVAVRLCTPSSRALQRVHFSTAEPRRPVHHVTMQLEYTKLTLAAGWILTAAVVGLLGGVTSAGARLILAGFAVVPPLGILLFWDGPSQTLSESIRRARQ